jgi:hypothetical protein
VANAVTVAQRRAQIASLWARGYSLASIARETATSYATTKRDVASIKRTLLAEHGEHLRIAQARVMLSLFDCLEELWTRYSRLKQMPAGSVDESTILGYLTAAAKVQGLLARVMGVYQLKVDVQHSGALDVRALVRVVQQAADEALPPDPVVRARFAQALMRLDPDQQEQRRPLSESETADQRDQHNGWHP